MSRPGANPAVLAVTPPPIADVQGWVAGRTFPPARPLLDVAQAVPSYPPAPELVAHVAAAAADPRSAVYSPIAGRASLRERFAEHLSRVYDAPVDGAHPTRWPPAVSTSCRTSVRPSGPS